MGDDNDQETMLPVYPDSQEGLVKKEEDGDWSSMQNGSQKE